MKKILVVGLMFFAGSLCAGTLAQPFADKNTGDPITAAEMNTFKNTYRTVINGNLDATNLATNAVDTDELTADSVTPVKLDETGDYTMEDLTLTYSLTASTITVTSTATLAVANITTVENSPTFTFGLTASTMTVTTMTVTAGTISSATITGNVYLAAGGKIYLRSGSTETYITSKTAIQYMSFVVQGSTVIQIIQGATANVEFKNAQIELDQGKSILFDADTNSGISALGDDIIMIKTGGNNGFQISATQDMKAYGNVDPNANDNANNQLGTTALSWYGLWYGTGGLNSSPCFASLKDNILAVPLTDKYATLPDFATYTRKSTGQAEKSFLIPDVQSNSANYSYIAEDGSLRLDQLVAQMSVAIKELNERVIVLENKVAVLEAK